MVACFLGIAAAFTPVIAQVISRPFIHNSLDGVWAVAAMAVFAAATLAVCVTRRLIKNVAHDQLAAPLHPERLCKVVRDLGLATWPTRKMPRSISIISDATDFEAVRDDRRGKNSRKRRIRAS
jgi:hypothetical protein